MKIEILMSTYNGEKYIHEQIDSILNQTIGLDNLFILVRDDSSTDNTASILEEYKNKYPNNFDYYIGTNKGPCYSFLELCSKADENEFDYFAFSDQDDFWLPEKLQVAINLLARKGHNVPSLYSSKYTVVDNALKPIEGRKAKKVNFTSFENSLIENVATGCTEVFNKPMLKLVNKVNLVKTNGLFMHDWLLYMLASSLGEYVYDNDAYILYRQHENNVLGAATGRFNNLNRKIKLFLKYNNGAIIRNNTNAFRKVYYSDMTEQHKELLDLFFNNSFKNNLNLGLNPKIKRQKFTDELIFRILIMFNYM